jgi:hypothetical protein
MRIIVGAISIALCLLLELAIPQAAAQDPPACNMRVLSRRGNEITIGLRQLSGIFNQDLKAAHSNFGALRLSAEKGKLNVSGKTNGTPVEISGPLQVVSGGAVRLHADRIVQNGNPEKGLMSLTGKNLADYAHFKDTDSLSAHGNNIYIHPNPLLNLSGQVTGVSLNNSSVTLTFASQPCR